MSEVIPQKPNLKILYGGLGSMVAVLGGLITYKVMHHNKKSDQNQDEVRVQTEAEKSKRAADMKAAGIQPKNFGQDLKFDSQGNLLGAKVGEGDLPENRTMDSMADKKAKMDKRAAAATAADDVNANIDDGQNGYGANRYGAGPRSGFAQRSASEMEQNRTDRREELELASKPMLVYSTEYSVKVGASPQTTVRAAAQAMPVGGMPVDPSVTSAQTIQQLQHAGVLPGAAKPGGLMPGAGASAQPMRSRPGSLADMRVRPGASFIIREGKFLDCVLTHQVESSFNDSPMVMMVARDFMSPDGRHVLFPAGTIINSVAGKTESLQQARLFISSHRASFPDGTSAYFPERQMPLGMNPDGSYGVEGKVNMHFWLQYGAGIMMGVINGLAASAAGPQTYSAATGMVVQTPGQAAAAGASQSFNEVTKRILDRYANIVPTISLEQGARVKVFFTEDVQVNEYMPTSALRWVRNAAH
jgi:type IV secretion system protein VirB10